MNPTLHLYVVFFLKKIFFYRLTQINELIDGHAHMAYSHNSFVSYFFSFEMGNYIRDNEIRFVSLCPIIMFVVVTHYLESQKWKP